MRKRACFGTQEYSEKSPICKTCENQEECKKEWEKKKPKYIEF